MSQLAQALRKPGPAASALMAWLGSIASDHRRGDRARLRRARSPEEALLEPTLHELATALESAGIHGLRDDATLEGIALVGMIGAQLDVRRKPGEPSDTELSPPQAQGQSRRSPRLGETLGRPKKGTSPPVSPARFRRLLTSETPRARYEVLRRLIRLTDGASFPELALAIVDWTPSRRRQLAFDYYDATSTKETT